MISRLSPEQQRKLAIALATVFVLVVGWRVAGHRIASWWSGDSAAVQREARRSQLAGIRVVDIRLDALEREPATYSPDRDLFRYPPPPPPPPRPKPVEVVEKPKPLPEPVVREPAVPVPPPVPYDLLGIFGPERRRIAALKEGEDIVNALEHETLKDQFIIHEIGLNTVEFRFVGFSEQESKTLKVEPDRR
ncbi:MAG: hypothetical protein MPN21_10305 [Thermoanaerobaculia bacterium]|nr:hypothetical protein [Thermoanaerobaculia bacterium]